MPAQIGGEGQQCTRPLNVDQPMEFRPSGLRPEHPTVSPRPGYITLGTRTCPSNVCTKNTQYLYRVHMVLGTGRWRAIGAPRRTREGSMDKCQGRVGAHPPCPRAACGRTYPEDSFTFVTWGPRLRLNATSS